MHVAAALMLLLSAPDAGGCTPASAEVVATAEKRAADADHRASEAESVAVRSGNPGAQARANQARAEAVAAQRDLANLRCQPPASAGPSPVPKIPVPRY